VEDGFVQVEHGRDHLRVEGETLQDVVVLTTSHEKRRRAGPGGVQ
jgi:hypothetical protein